MRRLALLAVFALTACSHAKAKGPAWPEPSKTAEDGGESLAPHETSTVAAALEKSDDATPDAEDKPAASVPAAAPEDKPATMSQPTAPANDDVIMSDEIIIEIDD